MIATDFNKIDKKMDIVEVNNTYGREHIKKTLDKKRVK